MNLYEFVNPSDEITFYAPDDDIAQAVTIYVGNGKAGLRIKNDKREMLRTMFILGEIDPDIVDKLKIISKERIDEFLAACHSFACCGFAERDIYDDYTSNGTNIKKVNMWHDKHLTSMSDYCTYARSLKLRKDTA